LLKEVLTGIQRANMKQVRFGKMTQAAAHARTADRGDAPRQLVLIVAGLLTGFLVAAIECL